MRGKIEEGEASGKPGPGGTCSTGVGERDKKNLEAGE